MNILEKEGKALWLNLIYLAAISMILIYLIVVFYFLHVRFYYYYIFYLVFQLLYGLVVNSRLPFVSYNPFSYFPEFGHLINESLQFFFLGFYALFVLKLLEVRSQSYLIYKATKVLAYVCFAYGVINVLFFFLNGPMIFMVFKSIRLVLLPYYVVLTVLIIVKIKSPLIKYFIVGNIAFFIGGVLSFYLATTPTMNAFTNYFDFSHSGSVVFQMGMLGEVLCFSIAIAHHVQLLQKKWHNSNKQLVLQLEKNQLLQEEVNKELDVKVKEATDEIRLLYEDIKKREKIELTLRYSKMVNQSKLLALRSNMNPHFIFNSLNSIKYLVSKGEREKAISYLDDFNQLNRRVLDNSRKKIITVEDELEMLELYLKIEKERLNNSIDYMIEFESRESLSQYPIPILLIQPFVENAIWHGLMPSENKNKTLKISFIEEDDTLSIIVEDNGIGRKSGSKRDGVSHGLSITKERIALFNKIYNQTITLEISDIFQNNSLEASGTKVVIEIKDNSDD